MKNLLLVFVFMFSFLCLKAQEVEIDGCYVTVAHDWGGMKQTHSFEAYGDVYVETNPLEPVDLRIEIVDKSMFSDLCVFKTTDTPQKCGEWRFVSDRSKARFTIRFVKEHADYYIFFVDERKDARPNYLAR